MDYTIHQMGNNFAIRGDFPGEVMGLTEDGKQKDYWLYKPGDVFIVDENGVLVKQDKFMQMMMSHDSKLKGSNNGI